MRPSRSRSAASAASTREARAWFATLSRPAVSLEALEAFRQWRGDLGNRAAYERLTKARAGWPVRVRLGSPFLWMAGLAVVALAFAAGWGAAMLSHGTT